jgi:predicted DNA-binding protein (UPF0251 family)
MPRPEKCRFVNGRPATTALKPAGIPARQLQVVELGLDELEAIRLADWEGMYFDAAGEQMGLSRATFGRLIERARHKVADALVNGKMLSFKGGHIMTSDNRIFHCDVCDQNFDAPRGTGRPEACPNCESEEVYRVEAPADQNDAEDLDNMDQQQSSSEDVGQQTARGGRGQGMGRGRRRARCGRGGGGGRGRGRQA